MNILTLSLPQRDPARWAVLRTVSSQTMVHGVSVTGAPQPTAPGTELSYPYLRTGDPPVPHWLSIAPVPYPDIACPGAGRHTGISWATGRSVWYSIMISQQGSEITQVSWETDGVLWTV